MLYNTTLKSEEDWQFVEAQEIEEYNRTKQDFRYEHVARKWEYGLAMRLIKEYNPKTMLNVGGGNSPLSLWAVERGIEVTEIDPNKPNKLFTNIRYIHENFPVSGLGQYELVVCTSVLEHIPENDMHFFKALLDSASDLAFITMDFHPRGEAFSYAHYRTYNSTDLELMIQIAKIRGFSPIGRVDYEFVSPMVYDYTFAALALVRNV